MAQPQSVDHISELSTLMKDVMGPGIEQQQNVAAMTYKKFDGTDVEFGGNSYEFPARMVNTQSVGARGYRQGLPVPVMNVDVTCRVRHKFIYGTFDIAGPDVEKGKGNPNAFVNVLTDKMRSLTEMVLKDLNMQTYLDGTGVRATTTSTFSSGVVSVDRIKYLRVGMHVNVVDSADGVTLGAGGDSDPSEGATYALKRFTIMAINASTLQITLGAGDPLVATSPTGVASGDFIVRHKAVGAELTGFGAIVDDGVSNAGALVLQDIDRASSPLWKAKVFAGAGGAARDLSLNLMQLAMDVPEVVSGKRVDLVIGSYNARDRYLQLLVPHKRFTDLKLDGGYSTLEYNGREFLVDVDCPDEEILFLSKASIKKFGLFDLKFVEQGGGILKHESLAAGDVFYGFLRAICNMGTTQANANAKITDVITDTNYIIAG